MLTDTQAAALRAALESDSPFAAAVASGSNSELLALLNAIDPQAPPVLGQLTRARLVAAIGADLNKLTADGVAQLSLLSSAEFLDLGDAGVRAAIAAVVPPAAMARIDQAAERGVRVCEAFGIELVELPDLWAVLPTVAGSHHARYLAEEFSGYAAKRDAVMQALPAGTDAAEVLKALTEMPEKDHGDVSAIQAKLATAGV